MLWRAAGHKKIATICWRPAGPKIATICGSPLWACLRFWRFGEFVPRSTTLHAERPEASASASHPCFEGHMHVSKGTCMFRRGTVVEVESKGRGHADSDFG